MELYINLKVNFRGNTKSFLLSGSEHKSWESMEATVKRSFGLCSLQLTYLDEENEEVSINSQLEYEEALKSAARQSNRLQMNVYESRATTGRVPGPVPGPGLSQVKSGSLTEPKKGFRPPQHFPSLAQAVSRKVQAAALEEGLVTLNELKGGKAEDKTPPAWFTSYMEKFKDQVVREAVEKICREFSGQCCIHKPLGAEAQVSEVSSSTLPGAPSSAPACSSCRGQTAGGGYQCSVCTSCTLCEPCSFSHDPSHNLVRARTPLSIPERGSPAPDQSRFYRRGDRSFRKAEKQRLKAEKRQLKAEVKEIRKQLRMERRSLQWGCAGDGNSSPVLLQPRATQANSPERPKRPCPLAVPAMTALLLDENLPDGSRLRPGTKFIKYWKMKNSGTMSWNSDTKLKFMWGNLAVGSGERWREVSVPTLQPGQVGLVSVALSAPTLEGTYTSHWRLAHGGEQFGPRVWCSIVVDPEAPTAISADGLLVSPCVTPQEKSARTLEREEKNRTTSREPLLITVDEDCDQEFYIPSVDLLTAQDLLSFELLDINIVQELESVPNNTPADITPCISPLPHDALLQDKTSPPGIIQEEAGEEVHVVNSILAVSQATELGGVPAQEKGEEDLIGRQFVSQSVIRSLTLGGVLDHDILHGRVSTTVLRPAPQGSVSLCERRLDRMAESADVPLSGPPKTESEDLLDPSPLISVPAELVTTDEGNESDIERIVMDPAAGDEGYEDEEEDSEERRKDRKEVEKEKKKATDVEEGKEGRSRTSSASSEDYIIILPDCFDTTRPLGESMYSSAVSQQGDESLERVSADANDMLCASQTLDSVPLTPVIVAVPRPSAKYSSGTEEQLGAAETPQVEELHQPGALTHPYPHTHRSADMNPEQQMEQRGRSQWSITVFEEEHFQGKYCHFTMECQNILDRDFRKIRSIKVENGPWVGYEYPEYQGQQFVLEKGDYPCYQAWSGNSSYRTEHLLSFRPIQCAKHSDSKVSLYDCEDFQGRKFELCDDYPSLQAMGWCSKEVPSIKVNSGAWVAYQFPGYRGYQYILERDRREGEFRNYNEYGTQAHTNQIQSIRRIQH